MFAFPWAGASCHGFNFQLFLMEITSRGKECSKSPLLACTSTCDGTILKVLWRTPGAVRKHVNGFCNGPLLLFIATKLIKMFYFAPPFPTHSISLLVRLLRIFPRGSQIIFFF